MSASNNSSRRQSNGDVNHNDVGDNSGYATTNTLCAAEAGVSTARRSDESDDELQTPSKFRKTMLSPSTLSPFSGVPLSSSMASIKFSMSDRKTGAAAENLPVTSGSNEVQTIQQFNPRESRVSLPMDMETALSILFSSEQSSSSDENLEYITKSKDEYITFRRANPSDAPTLASFIHLSQRKLNMQINQPNRAEKSKKIVDNELDSKKCVKKNNSTPDSESLDPLDDVAALEMRLLSGLGCNTFGEDYYRSGGDVNRSNTPSIFSILVERHCYRSIESKRNEKQGSNEQLHGLVGAALFLIRWDASNSCRYLDVIYHHVDIQYGESSDGESTCDIRSLCKQKNDVIWRRMMLRLSSLCLATECQSLHFSSVGRPHATKSDTGNS